MEEPMADPFDGGDVLGPGDVNDPMMVDDGERDPSGREWAERSSVELRGSFQQRAEPRWVRRVAALRERGLLD
jgi:hypothetical protein